MFIIHIDDDSRQWAHITLTHYAICLHLRMHIIYNIYASYTHWQLAKVNKTFLTPHSVSLKTVRHSSLSSTSSTKLLKTLHQPNNAAIRNPQHENGL